MKVCAVVHSLPCSYVAQCPLSSVFNVYD